VKSLPDYQQIRWFRKRNFTSFKTVSKVLAAVGGRSQSQFCLCVCSEVFLFSFQGLRVFCTDRLRYS